MSGPAPAPGATAPRSSAFFEALLFVILPLVSGHAAVKYGSMLHGAQLPYGLYVAAYLAGLLVSSLLAATYRESRGWRILRKLGVVLLVGAQPELLDLCAPAAIPTVLPLLGLLLALLVGADVVDAVRMVRASTATGEEFMFQHRGLSRLAVGLAIGSLLAAAATRVYLGSPRTDMVTGLLLVLWATWRVATAGTIRGWGRIWRGGLVIAVAVPALAGVGLRDLHLPLPRRLWGQKVVEAAAVLASGDVLWVAPYRGGATVRLHSSQDLPFYEAADEIRLSEALVHPAASFLPAVRRALVIGNESGAVARELLKYPEIEEVVQVSLQAGITRAFLENPLLRRAHGGALLDPRVVRRVVTRIDDLPAAIPTAKPFDLIISAALAPFSAVKWMLSPRARSFFRKRLAPGGFAVRWVLPLSMPEFAWCFVYESGRSGWYSTGYRVTLTNSHMEDFLVEMMSPAPFTLDDPRHIRVPTRTLRDFHLDKLFLFGKDYLADVEARDHPCSDELMVSE